MRKEKEKEKHFYGQVGVRAYAPLSNKECSKTNKMCESEYLNYNTKMNS